MNLRFLDRIAIASATFALAATALVYGRLPDPVPTHFDLAGQPNGWMPRPLAAWGPPLLAFVLWAIIRFAPRVLPRRDRERMSPPLVALVATMTSVFVAAVHLLVLYVALVPGVVVTRPVFLLVAILFVGLGLIMPRTRRNPIIGIRTYWTMTNDENWARTHRVAGYAMVAGGLLGGVAGACGGEIGAAIATACFLVSAFVPAVYSFVLARSLG